MKVVCIFSLLFAVIAMSRTVWCDKSFHSSKSHHASSRKRNGVILTKQEAYGFFKTPVRIWPWHWGRAKVIEECCHEVSCSAEEIDEFARDRSWYWIQTQLCEISLREGRICGCHEKGHPKENYECGTHRAGTSYCPNPCLHGYFYCGSGLKCVTGSHQCDSDNDCGNWKDEEGCRITRKYNRSSIISGTQLTGGSSRYWGNVYVLGRPVCDDYWDDNDANVLCRTLGFNSHTKGIAWGRSKFGNVGTRFRMDDVRCHGNESYIGDCQHKTSNDCGTGDGAGVTCVDPTTVELRGGRVAVEGNVYIMGESVCAADWDISDGQVVCNQLFKSKFAKRYARSVPVYSATTSPDYFSRTASINNVRCNGTERDLAQCTFSANVQCNSSKVAHVQCAKCTPGDLLDILASLKAGNNREETYQSVNETSQRLKIKCWHWNCSSDDPRYPEFCQVKLFLDSAMFYLKSVDNGVIKLQTKFDYGDLLNHLFMKISFSSLHEEIFKLGDKTNDVQKKLASYFLNLADFDTTKAQRDLENARNGWKSTQVDVQHRQNDLRGEIKVIFGFAFGVVGGDLIETGVGLADRIIDTMNPFNWHSSDAIINIKIVIQRMMKAGARIARLAYALDKGVNKINAIANRMREKRRTLSKKFTNVRNLLEARSGTPFTLATAVEFLNVFEEFEPSISDTDLAAYHMTLCHIVETACVIIKNSDSVEGALLEMLVAALGACPKVITNVAVVIALYQDVLASEILMMSNMAQIARARLTQEGARSLSIVLGSDLKEEITRQVAKWNSLLLLQTYKVSLIKRACDYITYRNHGQVEDVCAKLLSNPSLDAAELISFNYERDMCACSTCSQVDAILPIPAITRTGTQIFPKGTIDLSSLYNQTSSATSGWIDFHIPDNKWLLDNGWITTKMYKSGSLFFLQSLQLYIPPSVETSYLYSVNTNMILTGNYMKGKPYMISGGVAMNSRYMENYDPDNCPNHENSRYNMVSCPIHFGGVCVIAAPNNKGPIYPLLVGSTWKISLESRALLTKPAPEGTFYVKARAKFCYKSAADEEVHVHKVPYCCYERKMYFDQAAEMKADGKCPCRVCPEGSSPRLYGYYCESCSAGYETEQASYGCSPCEKGKYKPHPGPGACQSCPAGTTTITIGQDRCK